MAHTTTTPPCPHPMRGALPALCLSLVALSAAHAQMVPRPEHALRQATSGSLTTVRIGWQQVQGKEAANGLQAAGQTLWPQWEGRVGVVIDRPVNPLKDSFVLTQPVPAGLRMRSLHILSDYYMEGGFRATAGVVQGDASQAWWSGSDHGGGLNLSLQRLDSLSLGHAQAGDAPNQTSPYIGAGYSASFQKPGASTAWQFNADLGLIGTRSGALNRLGDALQGNLNTSQLVQGLGLRPLVKVSVGYAF